MELGSLSDVCRYLQRTGRELAVSGEVVQCRFEGVVVAMRQLTFAGGRPVLGLSVPIGRADRVGPRAALVANGVLPIGGLALWEDQILLRQTLPLSGLLASSLEQTLRALVDTVAALASPAYGYLFR